QVSSLNAGMDSIVLGYYEHGLRTLFVGPTRTGLTVKNRTSLSDGTKESRFCICSFIFHTFCSKSRRFQTVLVRAKALSLVLKIYKTTSRVGWLGRMDGVQL